MPRKIFVNLPVRHLGTSVAFFTALGFSFNPQFNDANATCMIVGEDSFVMLLVEPSFATFTDRAIVDARRQTEVLVCLSCDSDQKVDTLVAQAVAAGGQAHRSAQDQDFMYGHGFVDPDGHVWELVHMRQMPS
ncbi:glyoxalase/bleomycin resistance/extradiol dioxygenase family protein [Luteimonas sp. M1R5S18]|jgi:predicted lactoylglutathione lyase|uniref:Glyoxalase/bleomycin resistance/extradiol dioxygenase family protein n=1 Tax=Luteimonas rhizosphaericola TaxID=3042024 RepID=A0ABT6JFZ9_9GAMM|nr:VOC family protein [Luteimonas rhizosphaericola]MDH5828961.1 glyoxalase/bleomycin resistance/extradiol dioxygenase family protein [Luteimonas rhizosphaericola]